MKTLLLSALLLLLPALVRGQSPSSGQQVDITFSVVGWGQAIPGLQYRQGGGLKTVDAPLFKRSAPVPYRGPATLEFHLPVAAGKDPPPIATAALSPDMKRALVLLAPTGAAGYQALVVPDDLDAIPGGQALLMNLSAADLAIRTNKSDLFPLAPGESRLVRPDQKSMLLLQMEIGVRQAGGWRKTDSSFLPLPATHQTIVFFLSNDSDYFKDVDGRLLKPVQTVVLREAVDTPVQAAAAL